jgi:aryl-alcohol dehydrogenase-like predicted oxidoreductase
MIFRPLGTTGLQVSAIGLGGHWRTHHGRRYYDRFEGDEVPAEVLENRSAVVAACLEAGINYIDITTAAECLAYGRVLANCRERFIVGADDYQWSARNPDCCNSRSLVSNVERCLARLRTDYLDVWRVTAEVHGRNTDDQIEAVIEAADRLRHAGKIRFFGVSSHHPGWIQHAVEQFDAFQVAIVPCTGLSCGGRDAPVAPEPLQTIAARGLGLMTIKPFAGGLLFKSPTDHECDEANARLARLTLQKILQGRPEISCVLAGMSSVEEVRTAVKAASLSKLGESDLHWLDEVTESRLGTLPPEYAWLAAWHHRSTNAARTEDRHAGCVPAKKGLG